MAHVKADVFLLHEGPSKSCVMSVRAGRSLGSGASDLGFGARDGRIPQPRK